MKSFKSHYFSRWENSPNRNSPTDFPEEPKRKIVVESYESVSFQVNIEDAKIYLEIDAYNLLKNIKIIFTRLPIKWEKDDLIYPYYPEKGISAYKIYSYIANRILIQTTQDAFDLENVLYMNGKVSPETEEEIESWKKYRKVVFKKGVKSLIDLPL